MATNTTAREMIIAAALANNWTVNVDPHYRARVNFENVQGTRRVAVVFTNNGRVSSANVLRATDKGARFVHIDGVHPADKAKRENVLEWLDIHAVTVSLEKLATATEPGDFSWDETCTCAGEIMRRSHTADCPQHPAPVSLIKHERVSLVKNYAGPLPAEYDDIWGAELRTAYRENHAYGLVSDSFSYHHETGHVDVVVFAFPNGHTTIGIGQVCDWHGNITRRDISLVLKSTLADGTEYRTTYRIDFDEMRSILRTWRNTVDMARGVQRRARNHTNVLARLDRDNSAAWHARIAHNRTTGRAVLVKRATRSAF